MRQFIADQHATPIVFFFLFGLDFDVFNAALFVCFDYLLDIINECF